MVISPVIPMDTSQSQSPPNPDGLPHFHSTLMAKGPIENGALIIKLSFKSDPTDNQPINVKTNRGRFANTITDLNSSLSLKLCSKVTFTGNDNQQIDASGLSVLSEASIKQLFNHSFLPRLNDRATIRPHLFQFKIVTAASFPDIKHCCCEWLIQNNMFMKFQAFDVARTMEIGYLLNLEPCHIMRSDLSLNLRVNRS